MEQAGARVLVMLPGPAMIVSADEKIADSDDPFFLLADPVSKSDAAKITKQCAKVSSAIRTWNRVKTPASDILLRAGKPPASARPLGGDAFKSKLPAKALTGPMQGTVGVMMMTPESNGTIDANLENWTDDAWNRVFDEVAAGLAWWAQHAADHGIDLTFDFDALPRTDAALQVGYEPILHGYLTECQWIGAIMDNLGVSGFTCYDQVENYNDARRAEKGTHSFATVFVVNSINDEDGAFSDGYSAYAYFGGPFLMLTYDNGGWTIDWMRNVMSHEFGHTFWACDEYYQPGYFECDCTCPDNPWYTANPNCEHGCAEDGPCLMKDLTGDTCEHTREQIGWSQPAPTTTTSTTVPATTTTTTSTEAPPEDDDDAGNDDDGETPPPPRTGATTAARRNPKARAKVPPAGADKPSACAPRALSTPCRPVFGVVHEDRLSPDFSG
ncbi:MAG: hypothetical protein M5R36_17585 [Deltaproteobacteria bacterium]|nr:hypothetical protein [Deltaproteobacteria bacterium]